MPTSKISALFVLILLSCPALALKETTIFLPAVVESDYGEEGVMATLTVNVRDGSGHVYVDTWPLAKIDTQASARISKEVACETLFIDCSKYDFFYTIRSDAEIVGGPSGGAATTVATLASLLDLEINNHVLITGTINPDGSIGPVSGILEKAQASSEKGYLFLVPEGQSIITTAKEDPLDLGLYAKENLNLSVKEVGNINQAFSYFTNYKIKDVNIKFRKTEGYQKVMDGFGVELINHSKELREECLTKAKKSKIDYNLREELLELCSKSPEEAEDEFKKKNYYSAASIAFSNSISYRHGIRMAEFLSSPDKKEYARDYLSSLKPADFTIDTNNIELFAIIEERYSEAEENLDSGWKEYYSGEYSQSIYYGAYAEERLYTAELWNQHSEEFPVYVATSSENLSSIATETISDAYALLTYSSLLTVNSFSTEADMLIERARESQKKGNYTTAIVLALKARANAELASELAGKTDYTSLIELHRKRALISINQTSSILGQSYFEYAETLKGSNEVAAVTYYTYAEKLSKLNNLVNKSPATAKIVPLEYIEPVKCPMQRFLPGGLSISTLILFLIFMV
ncbi:MAG: hypothetical protein JW727_05025 [Candidatus Aenigmarchaeota archaeon]|nr:hypothetical protein [Candidatus Aenigmarchaeota archaeon]